MRWIKSSNLVLRKMAAYFKQGFCYQFSKHTIKHHNEKNQLFQLSFQSFLKLHLKIKQIESLLKINYIATLSIFFLTGRKPKSVRYYKGVKHC
jgi:hypothetical protein